jgi:hypothetical protein
LGTEINPAELAAAFDLGDEVTDGAKALEQGAEFTPAPILARLDPEKAELLALAQWRLAQQRRSNREQLIEAVANLQRQVTQKSNGQLSSIDLLRLRAMLMVILAAGWDGASKPSNSLQVLPPSHDVNGAWPRLIGNACLRTSGAARPPFAGSLSKTTMTKFQMMFLSAGQAAFGRSRQSWRLLCERLNSGC